VKDIYDAIKKIDMDIKDFITEEGRVSSTRTTEKYVSRKFPLDYIRIKDNSINIGLIAKSFSEEIYHYINKIQTPVVCNNCKKNMPKFFGLLNGYIEFCSSKCSNSSGIVKNKKEKAYLIKYGVDNPSKSPEIIDRINNTFINKYGANPLAIKEFQDRIRETNLNKYGAESPMSSSSNLRTKLAEKKSIEFIERYCGLEIIKYESEKNGNAVIRCNKCQSDFEISKWNLHQRINRGMINPCSNCFPIGKMQNSIIEDTIKEILDLHNLEYVKNERKMLEGKEIDFYLPKYKVGIEINGIYWHSEIYKETDYHLEKTKCAEEKGIRLIQIFEDEIRNKLDLVKSRIESILGIYQSKIYARKCEIKKLDSAVTNKFLIENHMQGECGSSYSAGLYLNSELVSVMTFGKLRKNLGRIAEEGSWELIRFCNKKGVIVIGGASKLLKSFIDQEKPYKIISYCDRRWSNGEFYEKIGFKNEGGSRPNYWYVKNGRRENRFKYRKDRLVKDGYDPQKSESSIMKERGFTRIYDCGSYRFVMCL